MTIQAAIDTVSYVFAEYFGDRWVSSANEVGIAENMAVGALKKQMPKELKKQGYFNICECGCEMSTFLMRNIVNYCPKCGQAIKW